jgi:hypothetical protein
MGDVLNIAVDEFCREMADAALAWLVDAEQTDNFKQNFGRFLQHHPEDSDPTSVVSR